VSAIAKVLANFHRCCTVESIMYTVLQPDILYLGKSSVKVQSKEPYQSETFVNSNTYKWKKSRFSLIFHRKTFGNNFFATFSIVLKINTKLCFFHHALNFHFLFEYVNFMVFEHYFLKTLKLSSHNGREKKKHLYKCVFHIYFLLPLKG
jgi:hypothetical protein